MRKRCSVKTEIEYTGEREFMDEYLIANTTKQQRIALIKQWIPDDESMDSGDLDLWDIYADYINGIREISEINESMSGIFYTEEDLWQ